MDFGFNDLLHDVDSKSPENCNINTVSSSSDDNILGNSRQFKIENPSSTYTNHTSKSSYRKTQRESEESSEFSFKRPKYALVPPDSVDPDSGQYDSNNDVLLTNPLSSVSRLKSSESKSDKSPLFHGFYDRPIYECKPYAIVRDNNFSSITKENSIFHEFGSFEKTSNHYTSYSEFLTGSKSADIIQPHFIVADNVDEHSVSAVNDLDSQYCTYPGEGEELEEEEVEVVDDSEPEEQVQNKIHKKQETAEMGAQNKWSGNETFPVPSTQDFQSAGFPAPLTEAQTSDIFDEFNPSDVFEGPENGPYMENLDALFTVQEQDLDVGSSDAREGICGLRNIGNTCFINAGLQCLSATPSLVSFFREKSSTNSLDPESLTAQFADLVQKMWSGNYIIIRPESFKNALGELCPQFKDQSQHDCQEFLAFLLDALHQQLLNIKSTDKNKEPSPANKAQENATKCSSPKSESSCDVTSASVHPNSPCANNQSYIHVKNCNETACTGDIVENCADSTGEELTERSAFLGTLGLDDILKDAKTSNVNVLVTDIEANNEIRFDSEKYPRMERRQNGAGTNIFHLYENNTKSKSGDSRLTLYNTGSELREGLDLKRTITNDLNNKVYVMSQPEKNVRMENERKMKSLNVETEEFEQSDQELEGVGPEGDVKIENCVTDNGEIEESDDAFMSDEDSSGSDGENHWEEISAKNRTVIFDSFQGQFKNTVICSSCAFKSVTYEPFMYLSVPLPDAVENQLCVTLVPASAQTPVKYVLNMNKQDPVSKIKQYLIDVIGENIFFYPLVVAEVLDCHISKILDDTNLIRYIDDINRKIYVFEQITVPTDEDEFETPSSTLEDEEEGKNSNGKVAATCTICLEDVDVGVVQHKGCTCVLCEICVKKSHEHYGDVLKCPVCRDDVDPARDFIPAGQANPVKKNFVRMLNIPLVYRIDDDGDGNNNQKTRRLFGYPNLLKVPSQVNGRDLYKIVDKMNLFHEQQFQLLFVNGQGQNCSRCLYTDHCSGCLIPREGKLKLYVNDTIAISFSKEVKEIPEEQHHPSMFELRQRKVLTLEDCVNAFCASEKLDECNPWYCPRCNKNQCATKTLSVQRFPEYLIVYLKRFVFHQSVSIKLEDKVQYPFHNFSLNDKCYYDLYACVCHSGGVSVGHYVAYTQHPYTKEWYCYNDETFTNEKPKEEDYGNAYILFYKKCGSDAAEGNPFIEVDIDLDAAEKSPLIDGDVD